MMALIGRILALGSFGLLGINAAGAPGHAQETHPFNVQDLWELDRISYPQVSPDGEWVVF